MNLDLWTAVDRYTTDLLMPANATLESALQASAEAGLPAISVSPCQGRFLQLLAQMQGARRILEIGTLGGYSTIWLARALPPGGHLLTLEFEPRHAEVARKNIAQAGLAGVVEVRLGAALDTLKQLDAQKCEPFDFIFIDADKEGYPDYFTWSLKLSRRGTAILVDNVVRQGAVIEPKHEDSRVQAVRRLNDLIAAEPRVAATTIQTVGSKGYDGFTLARVTS
jgi:predicted O-methyltransferase YrrM